MTCTEIVLKWNRGCYLSMSRFYHVFDMVYVGILTLQGERWQCLEALAQLNGSPAAIPQRAAAGV